jgi:hypothetical protein
MNQTLVFNTTTKTVKVYAEHSDNSRVIHSYNEVPTVGLRDDYYEVMQKEDEKSFPVLRVPIANTNMVIER